MEIDKTFPGEFKSLEKISLFVKKAAARAGLDELQTYSVELAVDEACSNIIEHAYGGEKIGKIYCRCIISNEGLTIILRDTGKSFDPDQVPEVNTTVPLENRSPGGAGVFLMRKVMDEVQYKFTSKENILTMLKRK